jgi:ketosteroid isomerase-like protein
MFCHGRASPSFTHSGARRPPRWDASQQLDAGGKNYETGRLARSTLRRNRQGEETMQMTRRDMAAVGAALLGAAGLSHSSAALAEAGNEAAVNQSVETLRKALLDADKAQLQRLVADQVTYGHSDGRVQNKGEFIDGVMTRKAVVKSITFPERKVAVVGDAAIARHLYESESETDGKPMSVRIGALQIWQKQDGSWKLLARQGYKLT